ncbi:hypothetical protein AVEN_134307-1, partial [Araneus ventricosus]
FPPPRGDNLPGCLMELPYSPKILPTALERPTPSSVDRALGLRRAHRDIEVSHYKGSPGQGDNVNNSIWTLMWCGRFERGCQLRCRPRHLTAVQNYEVRP